jgi:uncharacterized protein YbcI
MNVTHAQQLEQRLAQRIEKLYLNQLGHQPKSVACKFLDGQRKLAIFIQGAITKPEQLLISVGQTELAIVFRNKIEDALRPKLKAEIEQTAQMAIAELLINTQTQSENSSAIAILANRYSLT